MRAIGTDLAAFPINIGLRREAKALAPGVGRDERFVVTCEPLSAKAHVMSDTPKKGWFQRLSEGLSRSSKQMTDQVVSTFVKEPLSEEALERLEEHLIESDLGPAASSGSAPYASARPPTSVRSRRPWPRPWPLN